MALSIEGGLNRQADDFHLEVVAFCSNLHLRSAPFGTEARARQVFEGVQSHYFSLERSVSDHLASFGNGHGEIVDEREIEPFIQTTGVHGKVTASFARAIDSWNRKYPSSKIEVDTAPLRDYTPKQLLFYYAGKGELFLHGNNLSTINTHGISQPLSWDDRIPLHPLADDLWTATVYVPPTGSGKYKTSNSGEWSSGPNLPLDASTITRLETPTFNSESPLCVPVRIIPNTYKLSLVGEGEVLLPSGESRHLSWDTGLDMTRMGASAVWSLHLVPQGVVTYKFCLTGPHGEIFWEKAGNRILKPGEGLSDIPTFDLPDEMSVQELSINEVKKERLTHDKLDERAALELAAKQAALTAARPMPIGSEGTVFQPHEIIEYHYPTEFMQLNGVPVEIDSVAPDAIIKTRAKDGKWVLFQQGHTGCTAGASAFLMMDLGVIPDIETLKKRTVSGMEVIAEDLTRQGLIVTNIRASEVPTLHALRQRLFQGSIALRIFITAEMGHALVVDAVSVDLKTVRLRDPWHGWDITVDAAAFNQRWELSKKDLLKYGREDVLFQATKTKPSAS